MAKIRRWRSHLTRCDLDRRKRAAQPAPRTARRRERTPRRWSGCAGVGTRPASERRHVATGAVDSKHLLVVGTGPGLGASVARRFAREGYRLTLVARSQATTAALADELRGAGTDVTVVAADAAEPDRLRAAVAPLFAAPCAPAVVIYSAALAAFAEEHRRVTVPEPVPDAV